METKGRGSLINSDNDGSLEISADELKSLYDDEERDFVVIDVREPEEFRDWKIQGSMNVPLGERFPSRVKAVANDRRVITVCRTGVRSLHAVHELLETGLFVKSLRGGIVAWSHTYVTAEVHVPNAIGGRVIQIRRLSKGCTGYLIGDGKECVIVDPSSKIEEYVRTARKEGFTVTDVIDTHKHADHISGARLLASTTGAQLHLSPMDGYYFDGYRPLINARSVGFESGRTEIRAIHTPGHTQGSMSLLVNGRMLLSGDTLFLDGVGRPDLQGSVEESAKQLFRTCQRLFDELDSEAMVLPAHFGSSTDLMTTAPITASVSVVEARIRRAEFSDPASVAELVCNLPKPANYEAILKINSGQASFDPSVCDLLEEGPNRCSLSAEARGGKS